MTKKIRIWEVERNTSQSAIANLNKLIKDNLPDENIFDIVWPGTLEVRTIDMIDIIEDSIILLEGHGYKVTPPLNLSAGGVDVI